MGGVDFATFRLSVISEEGVFFSFFLQGRRPRIRSWKGGSAFLCALCLHVWILSSLQQDEERRLETKAGEDTRREGEMKGCGWGIRAAREAIGLVYNRRNMGRQKRKHVST